MTMPTSAAFIITAAALVAALSASAAAGAGPSGQWNYGDATFYGDMSGNATMGGACGYGDLFEQGYGLENTAVSGVLFNEGEICGACYEVECYYDASRCKQGATVKMTVTSLCPPDPKLPGGGLCQPPLKHFDMSEKMYTSIAVSPTAGNIPIRFRRVACVKRGGIKFHIKGNPWWILVLVYNVAGSGDVAAVEVKGSGDYAYVPMERLWGQNWQRTESPELVGQALSFRVTTGDGRVVESENVAPATWKFGQIFEGRQFTQGN